MTREEKRQALLRELYWQQQLTHVGDGDGVPSGRAIRALAIRALIDALKTQKGTR